MRTTQVLKDVKFPVMLDMFEMCSPELKVGILRNFDVAKSVFSSGVLIFANYVF